MARLEEITPGTIIEGVIPQAAVTAVAVKWYGSTAMEMAYRDDSGEYDRVVLYRDSESTIFIPTVPSASRLAGDDVVFQVAAEASRFACASRHDVVGNLPQAEAFMVRAIRLLGGELGSDESNHTHEILKSPWLSSAAELSSDSEQFAVGNVVHFRVDDERPDLVSAIKLLADSVMERHAAVLRQGTVLVSPGAEEIRALFLVKVTALDTKSAVRGPSTVELVEVDAHQRARTAHLPSCLDYRPVAKGEEEHVAGMRTGGWERDDFFDGLEEEALAYAVSELTANHVRALGGEKLIGLPPAVLGRALLMPANLLSRLRQERRLERAAGAATPDRPTVPEPAEVSVDSPPRAGVGLFSEIPNVVNSVTPERPESGDPMVRQSILVGASVPRAPSELQAEWEDHILRLKTLGFEVPRDIPLVMRSDIDGGIAAWIPAGRFTMGSHRGDRDERPEHEAMTAGFYMDILPVTTSQFTTFLTNSGYSAGDWIPPEGCEDHPVVSVSWHDADAYSRWAGKRLPTEPEWEKAARSSDGRVYPWGDKFDAHLAAVSASRGLSGTTPAGNFMAGASPFGMLDMAGNVWEWLADCYDSTRYTRGSIPNVAEDAAQSRVVRGGSWMSHKRYLRCAKRGSEPPDKRSRFIGFRCVS